MVRKRVPWYSGCLRIAHAFFKNTEFKVKNDYSCYFDLNTVRVCAYIDTKNVKTFHAHLLNKRNRPLSGDYEICLALFVVPVAQAKLRKLSIALTDWQGRAKLGRKD